MRKLLTYFGAFAALVFLLGATARAETALSEHALGNADAPVTIVEYASLTCSHCADFFENTLPDLRKRYIDTGKVRLIFRDFPLDGVALKAAAVANCMPKDEFFPFIGVLYKGLTNWAVSSNPELYLIQYAKLGGLSEDRAKECLSDLTLMDALVKERTEATDKHDIKATPTFILNNGEEKITGARGIDDFAPVIDKLLAAKH
jgi:protein-disulfide isomerase